MHIFPVLWSPNLNHSNNSLYFYICHGESQCIINQYSTVQCLIYSQQRRVSDPHYIVSRSAGFGCVPLCFCLFQQTLLICILTSRPSVFFRGFPVHLGAAFLSVFLFICWNSMSLFLIKFSSCLNLVKPSEHVDVCGQVSVHVCALCTSSAWSYCTPAVIGSGWSVWLINAWLYLNSVCAAKPIETLQCDLECVGEMSISLGFCWGTCLWCH